MDQKSVEPLKRIHEELQDFISIFLYLYLVLNAFYQTPRDLRNLSSHHHRAPERLNQQSCETPGEDSVGSVFLDCIWTGMKAD